MGMNEVVTAPRSPWQNAYVERVIGSIRLECLDHVVVFNVRHLRRVFSSYVEYYHSSRTHLSLRKTARSRPVEPAARGRVIVLIRSVACIIVTSDSPPDLARHLCLFADGAPVPLVPATSDSAF
jgi:hypothetical protein